MLCGSCSSRGDSHQVKTDYWRGYPFPRTRFLAHKLQPECHMVHGVNARTQIQVCSLPASCSFLLSSHLFFLLYTNSTGAATSSSYALRYTQHGGDNQKYLLVNKWTALGVDHWWAFVRFHAALDIKESHQKEEKNHQPMNTWLMNSEKYQELWTWLPEWKSWEEQPQSHLLLTGPVPGFHLSWNWQAPGPWSSI